MASIRERAKIEMELAKVDPADIEAVDKILELFFSRFNSGGAVSVMAPMLSRQIAGATLKPLTGADDEWNDMSSYEGLPAGSVLQNKRAGSVFKRKDEDDKFRIFDVDHPGEDGRGFRTVAQFPYMPDAVVGSPVISISPKES